MDVVYVDLVKTFDTVSHAKLVLKLDKLGFGGKILSWLKSLLCGQNQAVIINKEKSCYEPVSSGIPQGSILGPLLFISFHRRYQAAYPALLNQTFHRRHMEDIDLIKEDLHSLQNYFTTCQLQVNASKCEV